MVTAANKATNQSEGGKEAGRRGRRRSRGAYLSTNCYIVVDTAVKKKTAC